MKYFYISIAIYLLVQTLSLYYNYSKMETTTNIEIELENINAINTKVRLQEKSYIFTDRAWNIQRKKINKFSNKDKNSTIKKPLKINFNVNPIIICDNKKCFEFIGFKNTSALFYGSIDENDTKKFFKLNTHDFLSQQILITKIDRHTIEFYDLDYNKTQKINLFDFNISKYKPVDTKDIKNENK